MTRKKTAPYTKIAAELRARIERGALSPGDRVPSTREIMRRWNVAMATATKALTTLRQEGVVRSVPGVGTVVATARSPRGRVPTASTRAPGPAALTRARRGGDALARDDIAAVAVKIADAEGLAGLSMRRVAVELGVATMSLYRHVENREDLVAEMMDVACRELPLPNDAVGDWRAQLEVAARTLWQTFRRHPWLAPAMSVTRPQLFTSGLAYTERVLATLVGLGLDAETSLTAHLATFNYIRGTAVNLERRAEDEAASGVTDEEWMARQEPSLLALAATGRYPVFAELASTTYDFDLEAIFEFGLQRLLDGLVTLVSGHSRLQ